MKTRKSLLLGMCLAALTLPTSAQNWLTNGLVAYYTFDGNPNDASGYGNHGAVLGYDWAYGLDRFGGTGSLYLNRTSAPAINLDGAYVLAPRSPQLDFNSDFTLSAWVNLRTGIPTNFPYFPQNLVGNGADNSHVNFRILSDIAAYDGDDTLECVWHTWTGGFDSSAALLARVRGGWWQVIVVRSGSSVSLFRNGNLLAPYLNAAMTNPVANSAMIWLGRHGEVGNYPLIGGIDDVRMYNRALSPLEIRQLFLLEQHCIPHAATATARVVDGFVVGIDIKDFGCGYTNTPLVLIRGGGGTGAGGVATMEYGGVTSLTITNAGGGYTNTPTVLIASPPFVPWLEIGVSRVTVTLHVVLGKQYVLESSLNLIAWTQVGDPFTADSEVITQEFVVAETGRYFRIRQVP